MNTFDEPQPKFSAIKRLLRIARKELRESLRDRRTLVTLLAMPLIVYPLLAMVFHRFLLRYSPVHGATTSAWVLGVQSQEQLRSVHLSLIRGDLLLIAEQNPHLSRDLMESLVNKNITEYVFAGGQQVDYRLCAQEPVVAVSEGHVDVAILQAPENPNEVLMSGKPEILYREKSAPSLGAARFIEERFQAIQRQIATQRLREAGVYKMEGLEVRVRPVVDNLSPSLSLNALVPLVLILMTITGAVYPAIDLTAGERERGTLEPLIATPSPRFLLLFAKYIAVVTVAMLTAAVNILGMSITIWTTGLLTYLGNESTSPIGLLAQTVGLLVLFAAFFSAVLLVLTSIARSFKEAQAYLIPLMLISLAPGIMSLVPDLQYTPRMAVVPVLNMVLLARDLLTGNIASLNAVLAIGSTLLYALAAIGLAARVFGADAILYGAHGSWSDWLRRPDQTMPCLPLDVAMLTLALLFPAFYFLAHLNSVYGGESPSHWLVMAALSTTLLFAIFPVAVMRYFRVEPRTGLRWRWPRWPHLIAGAVLGLTIWPMAMEVMLRTLPTDLPTLLASDGVLWRDVAERLAGIRNQPWSLVLLCLAVVPGVCEEICFRGLLLTSLERSLAKWPAVIGSALLFGVFHVVTAGMLMPERLLPSTLLGIVLAWLALKSRSLIPGIIMHATHNSLMLMCGHDQRHIIWETVGRAGHVPWLWVAASLGIALGTFSILTRIQNGTTATD